MDKKMNEKLYKIKGDSSNRIYRAEINFSVTQNTNILTFNLFSVEKNKTDGNYKYFVNAVKYNQVEELNN